MNQDRRLLDTCTLSHYVSARKAARCPKLVARVTELLADQRAAVSLVTVYELRRGALVLQQQGQGNRKLVRIDMLLRSLPAVGLDADDARGWHVAADLYAKAQVHTPSITLSEGDLMIAATALTYQWVLVTTDAALGNNLRELGLVHIVEIWPIA